MKKTCNEELNLIKESSGNYNYIGNLYKNRNDYNKALENFQKALKIEEEQDDKSGISGTYNNIGIIYRLMGDYAKSLEYFQKSLEICFKLGDKCLINFYS